MPPERIAESATDIQGLLGKHGFLPGVAGHASAGNLHFMLTPNFAEPDDRDRYEAFMNDLVDLIVDKYDGSLKAEHGTGINMAPYVEREWGPKATELMWRIKRLADPDGVLAPGVILNRDPERAPAEPEVDAPDRGGRRHLRRMRLLRARVPEPPAHDHAAPADRAAARDGAAARRARRLQRALMEQYEYDGIETCAADGSCVLSCPLGIDTGKLIKDFRNREHDERAERSALKAAKRWAAIERAARATLRAGGGALAGRSATAPLRAATKAQRRFVTARARSRSGDRRMPRAASASLPRTAREGAAAVYVPSCVNRIFGPSRQANGTGPPLSVIAAVVAVSARAGLPVWIPPDVAGHCCAVPWGSKGYGDGHAWMANKMVESLWRWTDEGELPVVIDASSCTHGIVERVGHCARARRTRERHAAARGLDATDWARDRLLRSSRSPKAGPVAVHPTCSGRHLGMDRRLRKSGRGARRRRLRAAFGGLLRVRRRPRASSPRAHRVGDAGGGRRGQGPAASTRTSPPTAPARSAWSGPPAGPTCTSSSCWKS